MSTLYPCPCCGSEVLSEPDVYEICEVCGWEDDPAQRKDPSLKGGANEMSLRQAQRRWKRRQRDGGLRRPGEV